MQNIAFDRDQPATYLYVKLLAIMAVLLADTLESLSSKYGPRKNRARHELAFWVAYVNLKRRYTLMSEGLGEIQSKTSGVLLSGLKAKHGFI